MMAVRNELKISSPTEVSECGQATGFVPESKAMPLSWLN